VRTLNEGRGTNSLGKFETAAIMGISSFCSFPSAMWHGDSPMSVSNGPASWQQAEIRTLADTSCLLRRLMDELRPLGYCEKDLFGIRLALEEAFVNAIKHGNRNDTSKKVRIRYQACAAQFLIEVQDEGRGFDSEGVPDPLAPENLERPGGRGVFLMRHYMSWVHYSEAGNAVTLCKVRS
jgi:serine/threonine-protein kinase RsbW